LRPIAGYSQDNPRLSVFLALTKIPRASTLSCRSFMSGLIGLISAHSILLPCAFLLGGTLLALWDAVDRILIAPTEIPAGAMLALIRGPSLVWVIGQGKPLEEA
jgi:hypothetical protein